MPREWVGLGVPRELALGVPWFWSAGVAERFICDMLGFTSPFAVSLGAGDKGAPFVSTNKNILLYCHALSSLSHNGNG